MTANQLSAVMVERYGQVYQGGSSGETLASIDLMSLRDNNPITLSKALNAFAGIFMGLSTDNDRTQLELHRTNAADFDQPDRPHYRDLGTILAGVASDASMTAVIRTVAQIALNAYETTVMDNFSEIAGKGTGLSINFQARGTTMDAYYSDTNLSFAADTQWDEFLTWWQSA